MMWPDYEFCQSIKRDDCPEYREGMDGGCHRRRQTLLPQRTEGAVGKRLTCRPRLMGMRRPAPGASVLGCSAMAKKFDIRLVAQFSSSISVWFFEARPLKSAGYPSPET
jgi:hypothetical protein